MPLASDQDSARSQTVDTLKDIASWMTRNKLKLNCDKTEFLIITSAHNEQFINVDHLPVDGISVTRSASARILGVMVDSSLTMDAHIANVTRVCYFYLRWIRDVRPRISETATKSLIHNLVISRLDYCNSLLINLPKKQIQRLQRILNFAARIVRKSPDESTRDKLVALHWLPVEQRIVFKVALIVHKSLNSLSPSYITDLILPYAPTRSLRSMNQRLLTEHKTNLKYGERAFQNAAPKTWNGLPANIRNENNLPAFKKLLKTYLFNKAYFS